MYMYMYVCMYMYTKAARRTNEVSTISNILYVFAYKKDWY